MFQCVPVKASCFTLFCLAWQIVLFLSKHMNKFSSSELRSISIFSSLSEDEALLISKGSFHSLFNRDQVIAFQGDWGETIFLLRSGFVKVRSFTEQGDEIIFCFLGPDELFGEMSLLDGPVRCADVVALTPVDIVKLPRSSLLHVMRNNTNFILELARVQCARLRDLNQRFALHTSDATTRMLAAIAYLVNKLGYPECMGLRLPSIAQQELACLAGLSRETASRVISKLKARSVLSFEDGAMYICDPQPMIKRGLIAT